MNKAEQGNIQKHFEDLLLIDPEELLFIDAIKQRHVNRRMFINYLNIYRKFLDTVPGKEILLMEENSLELAILYFAALLSGKIVIPVDPLKGSKEISEISVESGCKRLISSEIVRGFDSELETYLLEPLPELTENSWESEQAEFISALKLADFDSVFSINYTSGTTGRPKGVMHSFRNHYLASMAFSARFGFSGKNVFYHNLPMTYMAGMLNLIFMPFLSGSKIVIGHRFSVQQALNFWEDPVKYNVNSFFLIPAIVTLLNKLDRGALGEEYTEKNEITTCIGTAPLYPKVRDEFQKRYKTQLFESYGLSETLFVSTEIPDSDSQNSVGKLLPDVDISFVGDNEILINCPWMFKGYQNMTTQSFFKDDYFISGDAGEYSSEKNLIITDRIKDIIIKGGINLSPKRIEYLIQNLIHGEFVILGIRDESYGEIIACIYTAEMDQKQTQSINDMITSELGKDYQIDYFKQMETLPRNINGKIDKRTIIKILQNDS